MVKLHLHQRLLFLSNIHLWLLGACWHSRSVGLHQRLWSKHHRAFSQLLQSSSYHSKVQNKCCHLAQALAVVLDKVTQSFPSLKTLFVCRSHSCTSLFCVTTHYLLFFPNCLLSAWFNDAIRSWSSSRPVCAFPPLQSPSSSCHASGCITSACPPSPCLERFMLYFQLFSSL